MASRPPNNLCSDWLTNYDEPFLLVPDSGILTTFFPGELRTQATDACVRAVAISRLIMADEAGDRSPGRLPAEGKRGGGERGESSEEEGEAGLTEAQRVVLERCIRALKEAKRDSQTLAALLLITRLCPANNLEKETLRRIFEAVGLNLPARLLVAAFRKSDNASLTPLDILALGTALLAALSTDSDMALRPQLLSCIPILLGIIANGPTFGYRAMTREYAKPQAKCGGGGGKSSGKGHSRQQTTGEGSGARSPEEVAGSCELDEAMASDCYQVLVSVCAAPNGPDHLLRRGGVVALCHAIENNQTSSRNKGLPLLCSILSSNIKGRVWSRHGRELIDLLIRLCRDFSQAAPDARLDLCTQLVPFLPPAALAAENQELREAVGQVWAALRPMLQSKLTPEQIGPILVLAACLLDVYGWQPVGPPKFCCLLVNRACVEIRMGLEGPPGTELSLELHETLTGCYRIMEAAMEQACNQKEGEAAPQTAIPSLSLQQTRQVLRVLEGASNALIYYLQQVTAEQYGEPFVFATFRCLCSWLAEETSCLKEEVTALLPFLINYARCLIQRARSQEDLSERMALMGMSEEESWTGREALRYLLPALCHLSAEEAPRKVLLTLDVPALLVNFLLDSWAALKEKSRVAFSRSPSMETACSALLNFTVTEPDRIRIDPCFKALEALLSDTLPLLVTKPCLLVLAANYCTLGLMMGRLKTTPSGPIGATQRRFFSAVLRFLRNALDSSSCPGPAAVSVSWEESWDEAAELWRLGVQALGGCVRVQPALGALIREEGWLRYTLSMLDQCSALPDPHTQGALEEALCALAESCALCKQEISDVMKNERGALGTMTKLKKSLG